MYRNFNRILFDLSNLYWHARDFTLSNHDKVFTIRNWIFLVLIYIYSLEEYERYGEIFGSVFLIIFLGIVCRGSYSRYLHGKQLELIRTKYRNIDPKNIRNWHPRSLIWSLLNKEELRDYDHFTIIIGDSLNMPNPYDFKYLRSHYYLDYRSQLIFEILMNAYCALIRNGIGFTGYRLNSYERDVLGVDIIDSHPIDDLVLRNGNSTYLWIWYDQLKDLNYNASLWITRENLNSKDYYFEQIHNTLHHLAWIKGRFDMLNRNLSQKVKVRKLLQLKYLIFARYMMNLYWNGYSKNNMLFGRFSTFDDLRVSSQTIWFKVLDVEPSKLLDDFYIEHPEYIVNNEDSVNYYQDLIRIRSFELYDKVCSLGSNCIEWCSSFGYEVDLQDQA